MTSSSQAPPPLGPPHGPPHGARPRRTRWLLTTPLVALVVIVALVVTLEAAHPQVDPDAAGLDLVVNDLPPLVFEDAPSCMRRADESNVATIREAITPNGRISSTQVFACPMAYDGLQVTFVGETIGELIRRRDGVWVQVNDDAYALEVGPVIGHREHRGFNTGLSVWLPDGLHETIEDVGRPGQRGDVIAVTGTLLQSDPDDGGGITLRAETLEVVAATVVIDAPFHTVQAIVATLLMIGALAAIIWSRRVRSR